LRVNLVLTRGQGSLLLDPSYVRGVSQSPRVSRMDQHSIYRGRKSSIGMSLSNSLIMMFR
jgi:hypothetical protein